MLLIRPRLFLVLSLFSFLALLGIGGGAYHALMESGNKVLAERLLFFSLTASFLLILLLFHAWQTSRKLARELNKVVDLTKLSGSLPVVRLQKLGSLGDTLQSLFHAISEVSQLRAYRIQLMTNLAERLIWFIERPILVVEATGKIFMANEAFKKWFKEDLPTPAGRSIEDVLPDIEMKTVLFEAQKTHGPVEMEIGKETLTFYPLHDQNNQPAYFLAVQGKQSSISLPESWKQFEAKKVEDMGKKASTLVSRVFQRMFHKK